MKKAVTALAILFCAVIVFFSFKGEELYYSTKAKVEIERAMRVNDVPLLPATAVFSEEDGDYVYTVTQEQGFSTNILTVHRHKLISYGPDEFGYFGDEYVYIELEAFVNEPYVINSSKELHDGDRVVEWE